MNAARHDDWARLVATLQDYCQSRYGVGAVTLRIVLATGQEVQEPLLSRQPCTPPEGSPRAGVLDAWAQGPEPRHLPGFREVWWPGLGRFRLTPKRAKVVERLWQAWESAREGEGSAEVGQAELLRAADSECTRLSNLFGSDAAWGTLVVEGEERGAYRLAELPGEEG